MALWEDAFSLSGMDLTIQQSAPCEGIYGDKNKWGVAEIYCLQTEQDWKWQLITKAGNEVTDTLN